MSKRHELPHSDRRTRRSRTSSSITSPFASILFFLASLTFCFYQTLHNKQSRSYVLKSPSAFLDDSAKVPHSQQSKSQFMAVNPFFAETLANDNDDDESISTSAQSKNSSTLPPPSQISSGQNAGPIPSSSSQSSFAFPAQNPINNMPTSPIPIGPLPLPTLGQGAHASSVAGASWTAAAAKGFMSYLPAFLKVKAMAPSVRNASEPVVESIFTARRKGQWIGCTSKYHLVCKGVYKAIKKTGAITVMDTNCANNARWLPLVMMKLRGEFRLVTLRCADPKETVTGDIRSAYAQLKYVTWEPFDVFEDEYKNKTDLLLAYNVLRHQSLIRGVRMFRRAKESGLVKYITFDNTPGTTNHPGADKTSPINVLVQPFMFPNAFALYEEPMEQLNPAVPQQIMTMKLEDLFIHSFTPEMNDLIDPRKRRRANSLS